MAVALLEDRAVLAVTGPEARPFLQGLVTNDIERLAPGKGLYAALLTPQGKILFDFLLVEGDGAVLIDCLATTRDALARRLGLYKLRSKVAIEPRDQLAVLAYWDQDAPPGAICYPDPRLHELGHRAIVARAEMAASVVPAQDYLQRRLALGVPESSDFGSDRMFALDADLDELHAVDFQKGCYVGQELTARMKHRGTARKRLLTFEASVAVVPGAALAADGKDVGEVVAVHGARGFALVRLDRLEEAGSAALRIGDAAVNLIIPSWLSS